MPPESPKQTPVVSTPTVEKKDSLAIPIAIIIAGALIAGALMFSESKSKVAAVNPPENTDGAVSKELLALKPDDHVYGNPNATVLVIEYSDPECPFCKRFHTTMKQVMSGYDKSSDVAWVYRHFPLEIHPKGNKEAEALECANEQGGNDAFWKYTDRLYEVTNSNNTLDFAQLPEIAKFAGLNVDAFNTCLASGKYAKRVSRDQAEGIQVGVRGTPYSVIWNTKTNKQIPINGAYPIENVKAVIAAAGAK